MNEELLSKLERLVKLKEQGAITEQEYEIQKAKLINQSALKPESTTTSVTGKSAAKGCLVFFVVVFGLIMLIVLLDSPSKNGTTSGGTTSASDRERKIASDVEYSYIKAHRAIKRNLKDPDSFEEIDHRAGYVGKDGVYVSCLVEYRAKNSFGGYTIEKALVTFSESMEPIGVVAVE